MKDSQTIKNEVAEHISGSVLKGWKLTQDEIAFAMRVLQVVSYRVRKENEDRYEDDPHFRFYADTLQSARNFLWTYGDQLLNEETVKAAKLEKLPVKVPTVIPETLGLLLLLAMVHP